MGRRTGTESALALVVAFLKKDSWKQSELARHLEIGVPALRKRLFELQSAGMPLESESEPPHVYWSVPKKWLPGGVQLDPDEVRELLRLLARLPRSTARERVANRVLKAVPRMTRRPPAVVTAELDVDEERWLSMVEDAASRGEVLRCRYLSASRGIVEWRALSPHRVSIGPPARFVATCHRDGRLKWFRVDRVLSARLEGTADARRADDEALASLLATSIGGFHGDLAPQELSFFVREPESRWVQSNLPAPLTHESAPDGIRVTARTTAVVQVARFVVGLGGAATAESEELRAVVRDLLHEALVSNGWAMEAREEQVRGSVSTAPDDGSAGPVLNN